MHPITVLSVALGGSLGAVLRYFVSVLFLSRNGSSVFPWGTFVANVAGCFLLGVLFETAERVTISPHVRIAVSVGVIGALTTFSTFTLETINLARAGAWGAAFANLALSVVSGFIACVLGLLVVRYSLPVSVAR